MTLIQTIDKLKKKVQHAQIKIFSEGSNSDIFLKLMRRERGAKYH